jgi:tetratricopeptide (TPR) repeat protein
VKKILLLCLALTIIAPVLFLGHRYSNNKTSIVPYPFAIDTKLNASIQTDAPIIIVGDMMAKRLATYAKALSKKISGDIQKPIQIESFASDGEGLHRTLDKIKKLKRLPFVIIYLGNIDNNKELTFYNKDMAVILKNLKLYYNPLIQSVLMMEPRFSRFIYSPVKYSYLSEKIIPDNNFTKDKDHLYQKRMEVNFKLYEAMLNDFFKYTLKANSVVIPITTALNLKIKPKKSCYGSFDQSTHEDYKKVISLLKQNDFKAAYTLSRELVLINANHASTQYLHAVASERINKFSEAQKHYELAMAYDCGIPDKGSPIYNAILRSSAKKNGLAYLDFHQYLTDQSKTNHIFMDELYPQDFYLDKLTDMLALRIKKLLKLDI